MRICQTLLADPSIADCRACPLHGHGADCRGVPIPPPFEGEEYFELLPPAEEEVAVA
jgi:hypothetical protein